MGLAKVLKSELRGRRGSKIDPGGEKMKFSKRGLMEAGGVGECESGKIFEIGALRREKRGF